MRVLVVSGPHAFATRDVYTGYVSGLRTVLGEDQVITYDIIPRYNLFHSWCTWLEEKMGFVPREVRANVLAAEPVFGAAHMHRADVVYLISPMYFPMSIVDMLRADGFQCWGHFTECPYEDEFWARNQASHFDHCFVNDRNSLARFQMFNPNTYYVPHAFNPVVHYPRWDRPNDHQHVIFVGTDFASRKQLFEAVDWSGIDLRLYGNWQEVKSGDKLWPYTRQRLVENHTTAQIYRGATVGISLHRQERYWESEEVLDLGEAFSLGPRSYELAACGLYQVSDGHRSELQELFGDSVPTFDTPEGLQEEVRWALDNPAARQHRAREQWAAVQGHTFEVRARMILELTAMREEVNLGHTVGS